MRVPVTVPPRRNRSAIAAVAAALLLVVVLIVVIVNRSSAPAQLCGNQHRSVAGGTFVLQNDEWNSAATECISYDAAAPSFSVATTKISMPADGSPGGYPSMSHGCFYGACTRRSGLPRLVSDLNDGTVTSDWTTTQPAGGRYDVAYDIWFNTTAWTSGAPDGAEMMIWLADDGSVRPLGTPQGITSIGGRSYQVWFGYGSGNSAPTVSYQATSPVSQVAGLDIAAFAQDALQRGYLQPNWYLIDVQAGFELWQGGQGLATNAFSVDVR
ncbi:MAG: hypothetical protein ABSA93_03725 [Streptosporangiaceae bacterium]